MKGDIGMANYEKQVEQEAAYPIPISLYNCYRTVRYEKRYISGVAIYASLLMPHCPVTVVQRYRDGVCSLLLHFFFIICHPYIPLHLEEMIFILVYIYTSRKARTVGRQVEVDAFDIRFPVRFPYRAMLKRHTSLSSSPMSRRCTHPAIASGGMCA